MTRFIPLATLALPGCTAFDLTSEPQLVDTMTEPIALSGETEESRLSSPVVRGATYAVTWTGGPEFTITSSDPDVVEVGQTTLVDGERHTAVRAIGEGTSTLTAWNDGVVLDEDDVTVRIADRVELVPFAATLVEQDIDDALVASDTTVFLRGTYMADGEPLFGQLTEFTAGEGAQVEPTDSTELAYETLFFEAGAGKHEVTFSTPGMELGAIVDVVDSDEIDAIDVACGDHPSGRGCVAFGLVEDEPVWGVPGTWSIDDEPYDGTGDLLLYNEHSITDDQLGNVTWGDVTAVVTLPTGVATVHSTAEFGCNNAPTAPFAALLLPLVVLFRRAHSCTHR